jgi:hypothetical protein
MGEPAQFKYEWEEIMTSKYTDEDCQKIETEAMYSEIKRLRAENEQLKEDLHYSNGCCELAMKHRDIAEAEVEQLKNYINNVRTVVNGFEEKTEPF